MSYGENYPDDMDMTVFQYDDIDAYLESLLNFGEKNSDWIFNLGHGFLPDIDYVKVKHVVKWIKEANWNRK